MNTNKMNPVKTDAAFENLKNLANESNSTSFFQKNKMEISNEIRDTITYLCRQDFHHITPQDLMNVCFCCYNIGSIDLLIQVLKLPVLQSFKPWDYKILTPIIKTILRFGSGDEKMSLINGTKEEISTILEFKISPTDITKGEMSLATIKEEITTLYEMIQNGNAQKLVSQSEHIKNIISELSTYSNNVIDERGGGYREKFLGIGIQTGSAEILLQILGLATYENFHLNSSQLRSIRNIFGKTRNPKFVKIAQVGASALGSSLVEYFRALEDTSEKENDILATPNTLDPREVEKARLQLESTAHKMSADQKQREQKKDRIEKFESVLTKISEVENFTQRNKLFTELLPTSELDYIASITSWLISQKSSDLVDIFLSYTITIEGIHFSSDFVKFILEVSFENEDFVLFTQFIAMDNVLELIVDDHESYKLFKDISHSLSTAIIVSEEETTSDPQQTIIDALTQETSSQNDHTEITRSRDLEIITEHPSNNNEEVSRETRESPKVVIGEDGTLTLRGTGKKVNHVWNIGKGEEPKELLRLINLSKDNDITPKTHAMIQDLLLSYLQKSEEKLSQPIYDKIILLSKNLRNSAIMKQLLKRNSISEGINWLQGNAGNFMKYCEFTGDSDLFEEFRKSQVIIELANRNKIVTELITKVTKVLKLDPIKTEYPASSKGVIERSVEKISHDNTDEGESNNRKENETICTLEGLLNEIENKLTLKDRKKITSQLTQLGEKDSLMNTMVLSGTTDLYSVLTQSLASLIQDGITAEEIKNGLFQMLKKKKASEIVSILNNMTENLNQ